MLLKSLVLLSLLPSIAGIGQHQALGRQKETCNTGAGPHRSIILGPVHLTRTQLHNHRRQYSLQEGCTAHPALRGDPGCLVFGVLTASPPQQLVGCLLEDKVAGECRVQRADVRADLVIHVMETKLCH